MKLSDIYKHKQTNEIIQIESFATRMNTHKDTIIIFNRLMCGIAGVGFSPSFNGYGTQEEIEKEYELLVPQQDLSKYKDLEDVLKLTQN